MYWFAEKDHSEVEIISISSEDTKLNMKLTLAVLLLEKDGNDLRDNVDEDSRIVEEVFSKIFRTLKEPLRS